MQPAEAIGLARKDLAEFQQEVRGFGFAMSISQRAMHALIILYAGVLAARTLPETVAIRIRRPHWHMAKACVEAWLKHCRKNRKLARLSQSAYELLVGHFLHRLGQIGKVLELNRREAEAWVADLAKALQPHPEDVDPCLN